MKAPLATMKRLVEAYSSMQAAQVNDISATA